MKLNRQIGKTHQMILALIPELLKGNKVRILGVKEPQGTIKRFADMGIKVESQLVESTSPIRTTFDELSGRQYIIGGITKKMGYDFYKV